MQSEMEKIMEKEKKYILPTYKRQPLVLVEGKGAILKDIYGKEYIDCVAGIAVNNVGHCHPAVVEAIKEQVGRLMHVSNLYYTQPQTELAEKLSQISGMDKAFFCNSGAESVEAALKLARKTTGKKQFIAAEGSFHGRTMGSLSITSNPGYRNPFEPMVPGVHFVPYNDPEAIKRGIKMNKNKDIAAVVLESIQVESGGINIPDEEYLPTVGEICDETDTLLILDEVQTGFGRTGKWFGKDHYDITPSIMCVAKAMGGGFPIGAMLASKGIEFEPGEHASTFGGSPLACAAALASIKVIQAENLVERASIRGKYFMKRLSATLRNKSSVKEIRGKGLMMGIELTLPCAEIVKKAMERGIVINCIADKVIRLVPPLVISEEEIDKVIVVLYEILPP